MVGRGTLKGGISGIPPAKVVILGAGVVGEFATKTALGLGASVRVFDNDISKLMRLQSQVGRQFHTTVINPVYLGYQHVSADVVNWCNALPIRTNTCNRLLKKW